MPRGSRGQAALERVDVRPNREQFTCGRTSLLLEWTLGGAVLCVVRGHGVAKVADATVARWEEVARSARTVQLLLDLGDMPTYETTFRKVLTQWAADHRSRLQSIDLLSGSKLVTMGAGVANIVLGGLVTVHDTPRNFDAQVRRAGLVPMPR